MVGTHSAAETPCVSAITAIETAAMPTPIGWAICRTPMARPRRSGGNQPTTTRPLAAFVLAAAAPPSTSVSTSGARPSTRTLAKPASAVPVRPVSSTKRSPRWSVTQPQATSVSMIPTDGAAATRPAAASVMPSRCSVGMRNAGPCTMTALAACASVLAASIAHRRPAPTVGGRTVPVVTGTVNALRAAAPGPVLPGESARPRLRDLADLEPRVAELEHRAGAVEKRDAQRGHLDAVGHLGHDLRLELGHARDLDHLVEGQRLRRAV